jgi:predicted enzyme related to lactoylglutathione lyase
MGQPVVHFEIIGTSPGQLRRFYQDLFGWEFDTGGTTAASISEPGNYGFVANPGAAASGGADSGGADSGEADPGSSGPPGIPGGVGGGQGFVPHAVFYVGVPDVAAALAEAERLGGQRRLGPDQAPGQPLVVGQFADPEGNVIGVAGPA